VPTYSLNGKNLLGLQDFAAHVNLNFFRGAQLHDAPGILIGTGKLVRHVTFRSVADIDRGALKEFIDQAIRLNLFGWEHLDWRRHPEHAQYGKQEVIGFPPVCRSSVP